MLTTILIFIAVLSILVFVHEFGHFLAAKRSGIAVEEFGMGLPPRVWGKKVGETMYSVNLLPIGGFVRLTGEDGDEEARGEKRSFSNKSPATRAKVLVAGVISNFVLAIILLSILFTLGVPVFTKFVHVQQVQENSVAKRVGILPKDIILSVDGQQIETAGQLSRLISEKKGREVLLEVKRGEETLEIRATPDPLLGIGISNFETKAYPFFIAPIKGLEAAFSITGAMLLGLGDFFRKLVFERAVSESIAGPVGIAQMTGEASQLGIRYLLQFVGVLSLNLALINILPFPALDGGRLLFVVVEGVTGRRVSPWVERWIHTVGMAILLFLIGIVTLSDLTRFR